VHPCSCKSSRDPARPVSAADLGCRLATRQAPRPCFGSAACASRSAVACPIRAGSAHAPATAKPLQLDTGRLATSWLTIASKTEVRGAVAWLPDHRCSGSHRSACRANDLPGLSRRRSTKRPICILAAAPTILERIPSAAAASDQPRNDVARGRLAGAAERPGLRGLRGPCRERGRSSTRVRTCARCTAGRRPTRDRRSTAYDRFARPGRHLPRYRFGDAPLAQIGPDRSRRRRSHSSLS
jgi:hypothetical protein